MQLTVSLLVFLIWSMEFGMLTLHGGLLVRREIKKAVLKQIIDEKIIFLNLIK